MSQCRVAGDDRRVAASEPGVSRGVAGRSVRLSRRRRNGNRSEELAVAHLRGLGWVILGRNVAVGRDELDVVALDPGPPAGLVFVEVRGNATGRFGAPEESAVRGKLWRTWRAAFAIVRAGELPSGVRVPGVPWRVDLVSVERAPSLGGGRGGSRVRHLRGVAPE